MSPLHSAEAVTVALVLVLALALALIWVRRRAISAGRPLMLCAVRTVARPHWRLGLLRFAADRLEWYPVVSPSLRPACRWDRWGVDLAAPAPSRDVIPGLPEAVAVRGRYAGDPFEIALAPSSYTAVRSWLESSPPGFNVNVA